MSSRSEEIDASSACHCVSEAASRRVSPPTSHEGGFAKADVQKSILEEEYLWASVNEGKDRFVRETDSILKV